LKINPIQKLVVGTVVVTVIVFGIIPLVYIHRKNGEEWKDIGEELKNLFSMFD